MAGRAGEETASGKKLGVAGVGITLFAVVCCAGLPLIVGGVAGGIAIGAVLGVEAGILAALALVTLVVVAVRRRRAGEQPRQEHSLGPQGGREAPSARSNNR